MLRCNEIHGVMVSCRQEGCPETKPEEILPARHLDNG
jgi:hypothetical protein